MKNMWLIVVVMVSFSLASNNVEARKGVGALFKFGQGSKAVNGIKNYGVNTLSLDELRKCLLLEQRIDTSDEALKLKQSMISTKKNDLKRIEVEITTLKRYLEIKSNAKFYSQQQLSYFNQEVDHYNRLIGHFNNELEVYKGLEKIYNSNISSHNTLVNGFDSTCAGKRYYEDDLVIVKSSLIN